MFKKRISYSIVSLVLALLFSGLIQKEKINKIVPELMLENAHSETFHSAAELVRTRYNYTENNYNYFTTLLEFGSTECTVCIQMELVLEEVEDSIVDKMDVVLCQS